MLTLEGNLEKIRLIHLGLGGWGGNWAVHVLPDHPDVETVAYVDQSAERRQEFASRLNLPTDRFFATLDAAAAGVVADAVSIAVPVALHEPLARHALELDKHVILEKPFAATMVEARGLIALAEARRKILAISQNYRFYPAPRAIAELARHGYFGAIVGAKIDFRRNAFAERSVNLNVDNPMLGDMAVHHFDLLRMLIGADPLEVNARSWNPPGSPYRQDPAAAVVLTFPNAVTVSYRGNWVDAGPQTAWAGEWQLDFERASVIWTSRGEQPGSTRRDSVQIRRPNATAPDDVPLPPLPLHDRAGMLAAFAETVRTGSPPGDFPLAHLNLGTLATSHAALRSAANHGAPMRLADL